MAIEQGLLELIRADQTTATLVNLSNGQGLYWVLAPKTAVIPFVVLSRVTTNDVYTTAGPAGIREGIFQMDCYGSAYYQAKNIANAVRAALWSYKGTLNDTDQTVVDAVFLTKDWDMPYEEGAGTVGFIYRCLLEFHVWYFE